MMDNRSHLLKSAVLISMQVDSFRKHLAKDCLHMVFCRLFFKSSFSAMTAHTKNTPWNVELSKLLIKRIGCNLSQKNFTFVSLPIIFCQPVNCTFPAVTHCLPVCQSYLVCLSIILCQRIVNCILPACHKCETSLSVILCQPVNNYLL